MHQIFREPISGLTHLFGALFAIVALCILAAQAAIYGNAWHMTAVMIFGATMLLMFAASTVYHLVHASDEVIRWLKRIDHIAIFLLIAGTYTPVCLIALHGSFGFGLLTTVWSLAVAGIFLKIFWISAPRWLSTAIYLAMGWLIVIASEPAMANIAEAGLWWIAAGGACYTLGAVIYALKWPNPSRKWFGFHEIWHLFVMGGVFCHFWAIAYYIAPISLS